MRYPIWILKRGLSFDNPALKVTAIRVIDIQLERLKRKLFYGLLSPSYFRIVKHPQTMSQNLWEIDILRQKREELVAFFAPSPSMLVHLITSVRMFSCRVQVNLSSVCTALLRIAVLLSSSHT